MVNISREKIKTGPGATQSQCDRMQHFNKIQFSILDQGPPNGMIKDIHILKYAIFEGLLMH